MNDLIERLSKRFNVDIEFSKEVVALTYTEKKKYIKDPIIQLNDMEKEAMLLEELNQVNLENQLDSPNSFKTTPLTN